MLTKCLVLVFFGEASSRRSDFGNGAKRCEQGAATRSLTVWNREGTEKLVDGKQHSVWFVRTGMNGLPQNVLLNFRLEFPKSNLTIYLPPGISEIFCQMVSTHGLGKMVVEGGGCILKILVAKGGGVQFSYEILLGGYGFHTPHFSETPPPPALGRNK